MLRETQAGTDHPLVKRVTILGRDESCGVALPSRLISRNHARIRKGLRGYTIEDLGSTHGTYVNDQRVQGTVRLRDGDVIILAKAPVRQEKRRGPAERDPRETSDGWGARPEAAGSEIRRGDIRIGAELIFTA
jgi:pSer/pThr/pTyr-binding forkhead associated (FHA) protein